MRTDAPDFVPSPPEKTGGPWLGLGIGFGIILVILGYLIYSSRNAPKQVISAPRLMEAAPVDPYAARLELTDVKMAKAENLLGGVMIYVEGKITNKGDRTVTGASVEITFRNALNEVVQRENHPVMVILAREPADDIAALNVSPLKPGETKEFRQTFEHVSRDWGGQYPELHITTVTVK
jgi:hypothetical protein